MPMNTCWLIDLFFFIAAYCSAIPASIVCPECYVNHVKVEHRLNTVHPGFSLSSWVFIISPYFLSCNNFCCFLYLCLSSMKLFLVPSSWLLLSFLLVVCPVGAVILMYNQIAVPSDHDVSTLLTMRQIMRVKTNRTFYSLTPNCHQS